jgi:hypothetical protein
VSGPATELLLFQVGARVFAAAVRDVVRIGTVRDAGPGDLVEGTSLGDTFGRERALVISGEAGAGDATLVVDQVLGVRQVPDAEIRPLPAFAAAVLRTGALAGLVLLDDAPTLIVDLPTLIRERRAAPA